jgi:hypothetical protein
LIVFELPDCRSTSAIPGLLHVIDETAKELGEDAVQILPVIEAVRWNALLIKQISNRLKQFFNPWCLLFHHSGGHVTTFVSFYNEFIDKTPNSQKKYPLYLHG